MFNKWIAKLTLIALGLGMIAPLQANTSGREQVEIVETAYAGGEYDTFLKELDEQYKRAGKAGVLRGLFESVKEVNKQESISAQIETLKSQREKLDIDRNQRLQDAVADNPDLDISKKVMSLSSSTLSDKQREVLRELDALKVHVPEDTTPNIENKISAIETEYYIKALLLQTASHHSKNPSENFQQKQLALTLEKLNRMEKAAQEYKSETWIEKISIAKEANHIASASKVDFNDLRALAFGTTPAKNGVEEKVKGVMMDYLNERQGLTTELVQK